MPDSKSKKGRKKYSPPVIKPSHRGRLREKLGTASGERIPLSELMRAKKSSNPATRKQANFAVNARKWGR